MRIKIPSKSLATQDGLEGLDTRHFDDFTLYFWDRLLFPTATSRHCLDRLGIDNHGTENDDAFQLHTGNEEGRGDSGTLASSQRCV
jgi:hypothetical protein